MAILISEFLPNPAGADAEGEWVELWNAGDAAVNLSGWSLSTEGGKPKAFSAQSIPAHGYAVLHRSDTKLSLKNIDGALTLVDPTGRVADRISFRGTASEEKSVNRVSGAQVGYFAPPSPGAPNAPRVSSASLSGNYPRGVPIAGGSNATVAPLWIGSSALIAAAAFLMVKWGYEELFFPRH